MPVVLVGVPLLILMAAFVAYGMSALQHSNSTGLVGWLTKTLANVPLIGGLSVQQILKLDQWITHQLGSHFKAVEGRAVGWVAGLSTYVKVMALAPMNLAAASWSFGWWLVHSEIPRIARAHTRHAEQTATHADAVAEAAMRSAVGQAKSHPGKVTQLEITRIERVAMPHAEEWSWINHHWKALTLAVTAPVALPGVISLPRVRDVTGWTRRNLRWHSRRIARLEKLLGVAGLAAVMARVLGVSVKCLRPGGNVSRVARSLCGLSLHALEDLLGLLVDVLILENICNVITIMEDGFGLIEGPLNDFIGTAEAQFVHCDYQLVGPLPDVPLSLPPVTGLILSLP